VKPPKFEYHDPSTVDEALGLIANLGEEVKLLAGGMSMVPLLNFRLASPDHLIDLNRIGDLVGIKCQDEKLTISAMTRQATMEHSAMVDDGWPMLTEAIGWVAHAQIRNRGTVGGSVAHADPSAELPVAFAALEARMTVASKKRARTIQASDFFVTQLTTSMEPDEMLLSIEVDPLPEKTGHAFVEFARRHGDYALGGAAALLTLDESGICVRARIALLAAAPTPIRAEAAEEVLIGSTVDAAAAAEAASKVVDRISPTGDIHGSTEYRRDLCGVMVKRALLMAASRANGTDPARNGAAV
jgi:CO/xanthine dehydrogenase FAD-binding subunit